LLRDELAIRNLICAYAIATKFWRTSWTAYDFNS